MNKIRTILHHKNSRALSSGPQGPVTANQLLALLTPMKRILCLCPVPSLGRSLRLHSLSEDDYEHYTVGIAVSDPYLAYATPIVNEAKSTLSLMFPKTFAHTAAIDKKSIVIQGLANTEKEFLRQIGYSDVGALLLALPLHQNSNLITSKSDVERMTSIRDSIMYTVEKFGFHNDNETSRRPLELKCLIDNDLTLDKVKEMAVEEPEMWEEITFDCGVDVSPHNQAAIALNAFLWDHTGGWRNTFG